MAMFKQMIGRGTRLFPDADKLSFDILDYSGATALFDDPEFDGPPERVDREEIDETGEVVDDVVVEEPEPRVRRRTTTPRSTEDDESSRGEASSTSTTSRSWVTAEAIYHLDPTTQRLRLVEYRDYVADAVRALFPDPSELRARWRDPGRTPRRSRTLLAGSRHRARGAPRAYRASSTPIRSTCSSTSPGTSRSRRGTTGPGASARSIADFFEAHQPAAREVLDQLLEKYAEHGIGQLDDLGVLQVPPLSALGTPAEIAGRFGSPAALREAVETLGELLYAA